MCGWCVFMCIYTPPCMATVIFVLPFIFLFVCINSYYALSDNWQSWFGKDGCLNMLPSPLKKYWQAKIDFPFPSISAGLTTQCIKVSFLCVLISFHIFEEHLRSVAFSYSLYVVPGDVHRLILYIDSESFSMLPQSCNLLILAKPSPLDPFCSVLTMCPPSSLCWLEVVQGPSLRTTAGSSTCT